MWVNSDTQAVSWVCHCWSVERQSATINWQPAIHIRFIPLSACCLTCALWPSGSYKPRMWCFLFVRRGYNGETGTLMTYDKGAQSWPSLKLSSLFFLLFYISFSVCLWAYLTAVVWRENPPVLFFHVTVKHCHPALATLANSHQLWFL